jgi:hypothetical protein
MILPRSSNIAPGSQRTAQAFNSTPSFSFLNRTPNPSAELDSLPIIVPFRRLASENAASTVIIDYPPSS